MTGGAVLRGGGGATVPAKHIIHLPSARRQPSHTPFTRKRHQLISWKSIHLKCINYRSELCCSKYQDQGHGSGTLIVLNFNNTYHITVVGMIEHLLDLGGLC